MNSHSIGHDSVGNPFQAVHTAQRGLSTASATYDFSWTGDEASFGVSIDHHLEQLHGQTSSSGRILVRPVVDSFLTFGGNWQYAWPNAALGHTSLYLAVNGPEVLEEDFAFGSNIGIGPPFGTLSVGGAALLLADSTYLLEYAAQVYHFDPTPPGTFGTGTGHLSFTITPVPEPSTLALLALTTALLHRRRSTRR